MVDVALIASSYLPHVGGVEEHVRHVARRLADRGLSVVVWTVDHGERPLDRVDGIRVRALPCPLPARSARALLSFAWRAPVAAARWALALALDRPAILHVQCFGPNGVWALALAGRRRLVITGHGETRGDADDVFGSSALLRRALRAALRRADAVTCVSRSVERDLVQRFGLAAGRAAIVANGVDLAEAPAPLPSGLPRRYVLGIGRLVHTKGFDLLLRAVARSGLPDDVGVVLAGDGPAHDDLAALATRLGLEDRVVFSGRLDRGQIVSVTAGALALAVPSRVEAFGIVVLEGWRAGIPVIAGTEEGPADLIDDGVDGLLVDVGDAEAFGAVLARVVDDAEALQPIAAAGRARSASFTWNAVADGYEHVYAALGVAVRAGVAS